MKIIFIFILALGVFSDDIFDEEPENVEDFSASTDFDAPQSLIVNGTQASEGQFPYQAGLRLKNTAGSFHWCSGSLIGHNWVITAAHCLGNLASVKVNLGSIKRNSGKITRTVAGSCTYRHSGFYVDRVAYDIGLIWIPSVSYTSKIQPIKLPSIVPPYSDYSGSIGIISGWGRPGNHTIYPAAILRYARLPILNNSDCHFRVTSSNMCLNASKAGACSGDSGSPVALASNGLLVGVHSSGAGNCVVGKVARSVRITSFLEWIKNKTGIFY